MLLLPRHRPRWQLAGLDAERAQRPGGSEEIPRSLLEVAGRKPLRVTTDRHPAYRKAVRWLIGRRALHRRSRYLNNQTEQSHRPIKQRHYPMLGFGNFESARRFCHAFDELRHYLRLPPGGRGAITAAARRKVFSDKWQSLIAELA